MPTLFLYALQASGAITLFYLLYITCFKKETFYRYNRVLLLGAFVISALLPLLPLPALQWAPALAPAEDSGNVIVVVGNNGHAHTQIAAVAVTHHWWDLLLQNAAAILLVIYAAVTVILLAAHARQLLKIRQLMRSGNAYIKNGVRYVELNGLKAPFSFLNSVFFDPNAYEYTELQHILKHEEAHVRQYHSADMLLSTIYCCLCWFNPFAWLCKRALQLNLEFLADEAAIETTSAPVAYQYSLLKIGTPRSSVALVHHFSKSFIKNRIFMMNKTRSPRTRTWRYLALLPVLALSAGLLSATKSSAPVSQAAGGSKYLAESNGTLYGTITRRTTDNDLAAMKKTLAEKGLTMTVPLLKRDNAGLIAAMKFVLTDKTGEMTMNVDENPIHTFFFYHGKESGIGLFPNKSFPRELLNTAVNESDGTVKGITTDTTFLNRFEGGEHAYGKTIAKNTRYPRISQENKVAGNVVIQYTIQADGAITNVETLESPDKALSAEVERVVKMLPSFKPDPAGKTVTVKLEVAYILQGDTPEETLFGPHAKDADIKVYGYYSTKK